MGKSIYLYEIYLIQKAQLDIGLEYNVALILPEQYESFNEKRWFKLEVNQINAKLDIEYSDNFNCQEQEFIEITRQHSYITQPSTILSIFKEDLEDMTNDINKKIEKRHLYSNLFGLGHKIAQIATEKRRYDSDTIF
ncbi:hypothetical protein C2G38_2048284 [Gigaspora rosea]|uniref:Uncharacterized protein n=1 Tax=Gigaspora rosea TaxID=44941 RepID=A0A397U7A2_9GLOM|nr:hypothetical protein C2G38_2048284 [Gigaspora rosea]